MKSIKPVIYLDACCFIDAVKNAVGLLPAGREDDVWYLNALMRAHKAGEVQLITSTLSIAECVAVEPGQVDVPQEVQENFTRLLLSNQYVTLAPQTPKTGRIVQSLRWEHGIVLKGADSLHFAAAIEYGAQEFISTDDRLRKPKIAEAATKLSGKFISVRAANTLSLPDHYLQGDWVNGDK